MLRSGGPRDRGARRSRLRGAVRGAARLTWGVSPAVGIVLRALAIWFAIITLESVQGALRRLLFGPEIPFAIREASVLTGLGVILAVSWLAAPWLRVRRAAAALAVGGLWVGLTLAFEITLGRVLGLSWREILSDYDVRGGGLMPVGLLGLWLAPWLAAAVRRRDLNQGRGHRPRAMLDRNGGAP